MHALFDSGAIGYIALLLLAVEYAGLTLYRALAGRGPDALMLAGNFLAGASLMLAVTAALTHADWPWVAVWLSAGLAAHVFDLRQRWPACADRPIRSRTHARNTKRQ